MKVYGVLLQIPGMEAQNLTYTEQLVQAWENAGFMRWPLGACLLLGILVIIWKFFTLMAKTGATRKTLRDVDELLASQRIDEALRGRRTKRNQWHGFRRRWPEPVDLIFKFRPT